MTDTEPVPRTIRAMTAAALGAGFAVCGGALRLRRHVRRSRARLDGYGARRVELSHGAVTYVDAGLGESLLSSHGLYGGYDQALENVRTLGAHCRIIAPSRFGYPGSDVRGDGSPREQAAVFAELLDHLGIARTFVLGASAGGTPAIRFALDYPDRVKGLILLSSAAPWARKPRTPPRRLGPPAWMNRDGMMWLLSPVFPLVMSMPSRIVHTMMPLAERRVGADLDARLTNRDMAVRFDDYPIEELTSPVLLVHARDDKLAVFAAPRGQVLGSLRRYPNLTTVIYDTGGHLVTGHSQEIDALVSEFVDRHGR